MRDASGIQQRLHRVAQLRRHDVHQGTGVEQQINFAGSDRTTAHYQHGALAQVDEYRQVVHGDQLA